MRYLLGTAVGLLGSVCTWGVAVGEPKGEPQLLSEPKVVQNAPLETNAISPREMALDVAQQFTRTPLSDALEHELGNLPSEKSEQQKKEHDALIAFYRARDFSPLWVRESGLTPKAKILISELDNAGAWGLEPDAFSLSVEPQDKGKDVQSSSLTDVARREIKLTMRALLYARYARGGRIMKPAEMLNTNLDRKPKLLEPTAILRGLASAQYIDSYLQSLHPVHAQFHNLRQAYLARRAKSRIVVPRTSKDKTSIIMTPKQTQALRARLGLRKKLSNDTFVNTSVLESDLKKALQDFQQRHGIEPADGSLSRATVRALNKRPKVSTKRLLANMEQWRWMWEDMGKVHVFANIPEYMIYVYKNGKVIHSERIVVGEIGKQTSVFTRKLKNIVLRPMWRVPESIKVRELWPDLRRNGSMFRKYGLQLESKDGRKLDYRKINWSKADIRNYEVVQPPGRKSVMGVVKFSFPSQHTIFMHDTPDKYMFKRRQRTLSHGCLRLRNPVKMAHILLEEDKGWSLSQLKKLISSGPTNNAIEIDSRIPIHLAYFTVWAGRDGSVRVFRDIYGHEKRISLAIEGKWNKISKGRDHLAAVQPLKFNPKSSASKKRARKRAVTPNDYVNAALGGGF